MSDYDPAPLPTEESLRPPTWADVAARLLSPPPVEPHWSRAEAAYAQAANLANVLNEVQYVDREHGEAHDDCLKVGDYDDRCAECIEYDEWAEGIAEQGVHLMALCRREMALALHRSEDEMNYMDLWFSQIPASNELGSELEEQDNYAADADLGMDLLEDGP